MGSYKWRWGKRRQILGEMVRRGPFFHFFLVNLQEVLGVAGSPVWKLVKGVGPWIPAVLDTEANRPEGEQGLGRSLWNLSVFGL